MLGTGPRRAGIMPDITYRVLGEHYMDALKVDGERWRDERDGSPVWDGRRVWRLVKGQTSRVFARLMGFAGERWYQITHRTAVKV